MDPLATVVDGLAGPGMGAALVGLVWALARSIRRRGEGAAAQDEANAKAVVELVVQLGALRADLGRVQAEVTQLRLEVDAGELALAAERDRANRAELAAQEATAWAKSLAEEMAELRKAILGGHTLPSNLPPAR